MLSRERRELRGGPPGARGDARSAGGPGADRDADPPWAPRDRALRTLDPADRGHSNVGGPRHSAGSSVHRAAPRVRVGSAPRRPGDPRLADGGVRLRRARGGEGRGEARHRAHGAAGRARVPRGMARVQPPVPWTPSVGVSAVRAPAWPARSSSGGSLPRGSASPGLGGGRRGPLRLVGYAFCWIAVSTRSAVSGALRTRAPVAAKIAFESAGRIVVVPGSPRPVGYSVDGTTCTWTSGTSLILNTW